MFYRATDPHCDRPTWAARSKALVHSIPCRTCGDSADIVVRYRLGKTAKRTLFCKRCHEAAMGRKDRAARQLAALGL